VTGAEYALIAAVIFLAACLQASSGFGMGMLAAPVIAMVEAVLSREGLAWVVAAVVLTGLVLAGWGWAPRPIRANLIVAGAASGIMGTATSIGGPPMALVWQGHDGPRMRGTMSAFFMVGSTISIGMLWIAGAVTAEMLVLALWMVPAVVAGYAASRFVSRFLNAASRFVNRFLNAARLKSLALGASALGSVLLIVQLVL
jgi:uncharacterized membrane protein YfcA